MQTENIQLIINSEKDSQLQNIGNKVIHNERLSFNEGVYLFEKASLPYVGALANWKVFSCKFCSYSKLYAHKEEGWELTIDQMMDIVKSYDGKPVTEVHIVGGVHPKLTLEFFLELMRTIKAHRPELHIKAFTPVELEYMFRKAKVTTEEGFHPDIRTVICADKATADEWLHIHKTAHNLGMHSNATLLYGHIEKYEHRIDHMERLRQLQDETKGFNTFIPLKFRNKDNDMHDVPESTLANDLKMYAISRLYLDNFPHVKAYWPMLGRETAQLTLSYGVNDIDGTIDDTTKIYSMAGSEEQTPVMTTEQLVGLIKQAKRQPIERGTLYNVIQDYSNYEFAENEM
ncbi:MAG: aminofutalosine synthase MqnE [Chitinophagia bacterium]|nr:aminofutalosine synthase MqnE [Chitinophagia bacterium]